MIFWLGVAALIVTILSFFIHNVFIQMFIFVILSALLLLCTRPLVDKFVNKGDKPVTTNAYSIIGKEGKVIKGTDSVTKILQIKVGSETWTAKSDDGSVLQEGDSVLVDNIEGVKAIVRKI